MAIGIGPLDFPDLPDVRIFACPGPEGLELALGLTHPGIEEIEFAQSLSTRFGIAIHRIEANG